MNRRHAAVISLFLAFALVLGMAAALRTTQLGATASAKPKPQQVAAKSRLLDRYQAQLERAARQRPPALPPLPRVPAAASASAVGAGGALAASAPQRVIYVRPKPIVHVVHRHGGDDAYEHGHDSEGGSDGAGSGLND